jgi:hypothetical protein
MNLFCTCFSQICWNQQIHVHSVDSPNTNLLISELFFQICWNQQKIVDSVLIRTAFSCSGDVGAAGAWGFLPGGRPLVMLHSRRQSTSGPPPELAWSCSGSVFPRLTLLAGLHHLCCCWFSADKSASSAGFTSARVVACTSSSLDVQPYIPHSPSQAGKFPCRSYGKGLNMPRQTYPGSYPLG